MSTDTDGSHDGDRMEKIDVRVPADLLEQINKEYGRRGYASRSEAIRDALRDWLNPSVELSDDVLEDLATSREQRDRDETRSLESVMDKYGVDGDDSDRDEQ